MAQPIGKRINEVLEIVDELGPSSYRQVYERMDGVLIENAGKYCPPARGVGMKPFKRDAVKPGDELALARLPDIRMRFKFMGHDGDVVATWTAPQPDRPLDVILRQREVLIVDAG